MTRKLKIRYAVLLISIEVFLFVPSCLFQKVDSGVKSSIQYWRDTGLTAKDLEIYLTNENCFSSQKKFLACVNAVTNMAEKVSLTIDLNGELKPLTPQDFDFRVSEKKDLERWIPIFNQQEVSLKFSFMETWKKLEKLVDPNSMAFVIASGINGFLSVSEDPHTYIMPIAMYEEVISNNQTRQDKAGFIFRRSNGQYVVKKVFEGSAAYRAGLKASDKIIEVNGQSVSKIAPYLVYDSLKMKDQARLGLTVQRKKLIRYIEIIKSETSFPSVNAKLLQKDINSRRQWGLLQIHRFSKDSCAIAKQEVITLVENGSQGILIDVRDNPGGQLEEAACIANLFVEKGVKLFETRYLDVSRTGEKYFAEEDSIFNGPVAVLINSGSASASEILAGALKDQQRALLVGEKTFGKGSFQDGSIWEENPKIALFRTEGFYYFPSGWTPQLVGLEPDLPVEFDNSEQQREINLYFSPLVPKDAWSGPQTLAWLNEQRCGRPNLSLEDDPQVRVGQNALDCQSKRTLSEIND